jgi:polyhydroxyalkanoate synthesis regulator phasin
MSNTTEKTTKTAKTRTAKTAKTNTNTNTTSTVNTASATSKTNKKAQAKSTKTAKTTTVQPNAFNFIKTVQAPVELFKDVTTKSIYFSLGLGALLLDSRQNLQTIQNFKFNSLRNTFNGDLRENVNSFINNTISKGEKVEKTTAQTIKEFQESQRTRVREFFTTPKPRIQSENTIEAKIEEVISSLDLPTRDELQQINRRLSDISRQISSNQRGGASRKAKATKTEQDKEVVATEVVEETVEVASV